MEHADNGRECYEWVVSLSPVRNMSTGRENTRMNLAKPMSIGSLRHLNNQGSLRFRHPHRRDAGARHRESLAPATPCTMNMSHNRPHAPHLR
jgi:hypothetical protein